MKEYRFISKHYIKKEVLHIEEHTIYGVSQNDAFVKLGLSLVWRKDCDRVEIIVSENKE